MDATATMIDGTKIDGVVGLRGMLERYSPQFVRVVTEKLLTYALGRGVEDGDMPTVRSIVRGAEPSEVPVLVDRARYREERLVPDEPEAEVKVQAASGLTCESE